MYFFNRQKSIIFLAIFCVFVLTACSTKTAVAPISIEAVKQNMKYENILFSDFINSPSVQANVPTAGPISDCKSTAKVYLSGKNIFNSVENTERKQVNRDEGPTLIVNGELTYLKIVSGAARFWGGALAGRSCMKIKILLTDASTGSIVAQKELLGAPGAMSGAWTVGGADRALPSKMGYLVGDFILENVGH